MSETTPALDENTAPVAADPARAPKKRSGWVTLLLLLGIVAIFGFSLMLAPKPGEGEEGFGGTDSVVTGMLEEAGAEPWFRPVFELGSGELESGLFALQAAIGAGLFGFALGRLSGRSKRQSAGAGHVSPADVPTPSA